LVGVEVLRVQAQYVSGVSNIDDQRPVEQFPTELPTNRPAIAFARGAQTGILITSAPSPAQAASKAGVNRAPRS